MPAKLIPDAVKGYWLVTAYHAPLVAALKDFPAEARAWDPKTRRWWIADEWLDDVVEVVEHYGPLEPFERARRSRRDKPAARTGAGGVPRTREEAFEALYLLPDAPVEVWNAAHKALCLLYHPDRAGGSSARIATVNAARDILRNGK